MGVPGWGIDWLEESRPLDRDCKQVWGDGSVGTADLLMLLSAWGDCPDRPDPCPADFNGDGVVGTSDLLQLLGAWG